MKIDENFIGLGGIGFDFQLSWWVQFFKTAINRNPFFLASYLLFFLKYAVPLECCRTCCSFVVIA